MKRMLCLLVLVAACGGSDNEQQAANCTADTATATMSVAIKDIAFSPACVKVAKGSTVTFTNEDSVAHTVTTDASQAETFDSGSLAQNGTFKHTFMTAGTIKAHCNFHSDMHVAIVVQ